MEITAEYLRLHQAWLNNDPDGQRLERPDADLLGADLRGANLRDADLLGADLRGANLRDADLIGADLRGANLRGANLRDADLLGADLRGANLRYADLLGADLRGANLRDADLRDADLLGADLRGANLRYANLRDADLRDAEGLPIAKDATKRLKAVAEAALQPNALRMDAWHTCGTSHCIAGWAIHLAGEPGRIMESMMGAHLAGMLLLGTEAATHFYDSNEKACEWLQSVLSA